MKVNLTIDLGEVEICTDSGHFEIDRIMHNGLDYSGKSAVDLVLAMVGGHRKFIRLAEMAIDRYRDEYKEPEILRDEEELFGAPV